MKRALVLALLFLLLFLVARTGMHFVDKVRQFKSFSRMGIIADHVFAFERRHGLERGVKWKS